MTSLDQTAPAILVVDDDSLLRGLAVDVLRSEGYRAAGVEGAAEALLLLQPNSELSLLITDINMPGMNGLELVDAVAASLPDLKVLVMSGRERLEATQLPHTVQFLQKPFSAKALLERVGLMMAVRPPFGAAS